MRLNPTSKVALLVAATLALLIIFNLSNRAPESQIQLLYTAWLKKCINLGTELNDQQPPIKIALTAQGAKDPLNFEIASNNFGSSEKFRRLLELADTAKLFSQAPPLTDLNSELAWKLTIENGPYQFESLINEAMLEDIRIQNFLKLLQFYAGSNSSQPATTSDNFTQKK